MWPWTSYLASLCLPFLLWRLTPLHRVSSSTHSLNKSLICVRLCSGPGGSALHEAGRAPASKGYGRAAGVGLGLGLSTKNSRAVSSSSPADICFCHLIPNVAVACDFHLFTEHQLNIMYSSLKIWRRMLLWPLFYRWRN